MVGFSCVSMLFFALFLLLLVGLIYWCFRPNRLHVDLHVAGGFPDLSPLPPE